jgi:predicted aconitase with swiveling domain
MTARLHASILTPGLAASAPPLILTAPISFWGGVDPSTGTIIDARHPERGRCVAGMVLGLPGTIGSSSASSVLLELVRAGHAPAALLMPEPDAILLLGLIVAREMGWPAPPALRLPAAEQRALASATMVEVSTDGTVSW